MKRHEQSIEDHVKGNVSFAIDQANEYGGLQGSRDSFHQNTIDSVIEDGYTADEAWNAGLWFSSLFCKETGLE